MKLQVYDRFKDYDKDHCWQYEIREQNHEEDITAVGLTQSQVESLRIDDFVFDYVDKTDKVQCAEITEFIKRHEWLGKLQQRSTHRFTARLKSNGALAGVVIMATPNAFSKNLGPDTKDIEKLISRGACISWSPKNMGSWIVMQSIKWMVANTDFRFFTAYSDPEAKELGTIYQASNFLYMGQTAGSTRQYFDPNNPKLGWFSDREFRKRGKYIKYAAAIGLSKEEWSQYMKKYSPDWDSMPPGMKESIKAEERKFRNSCHSRPVPPKHKYGYILGCDKKETRELKKLYRTHSPKKIDLPYPTERGE